MAVPRDTLSDHMLIEPILSLETVLVLSQGFVATKRVVNTFRKPYKYEVGYQLRAPMTWEKFRMSVIRI